MGKKSRHDGDPVTNEFRVKQWRAPNGKYYTTVSRLNKSNFPETVITTDDPVAGAEAASSALMHALFGNVSRIANVDVRPPQDRKVEV